MYNTTGLEYDEQVYPNYTPTMYEKMLQKRYEKIELSHIKGYQPFHGEAGDKNVRIVSNRAGA